MTKIILVLD